MEYLKYFTKIDEFQKLLNVTILGLSIKYYS